MYEKNVHKWMIPFLERCEAEKPGSFTPLINDYLVTMAKTDLTLCLKIFQLSRADVSYHSSIRSVIPSLNYYKRVFYYLYIRCTLFRHKNNVPEKCLRIFETLENKRLFCQIRLGHYWGIIFHLFQK